MKHIESWLLFLSFSAIFLLIGYLIGKISTKRVVTILLLFLASIIPFGTVLNLAWRKTTTPQLLLIAIIRVTLTVLFVLAGCAIGKQGKGYHRRLGWVGVCLLCSLQSAESLFLWIDSTHLLDSLRWHQVNKSHIRVGAWEFDVPPAWYPDHKGEVFWHETGASDVVHLQRASLSDEKDQPSMIILTPASSVQHSRKPENPLIQDKRFQIHGEYGECSMTVSKLGYDESCWFSNADIYINIKGQTERDLIEATHMLSLGRFIHKSNPDTARQNS